MKPIIIVLALLAFAPRLSGAVFVGGVQFPSSVLAGAASTPVAGVLTLGGLALQPDPVWAGKLVIVDRGQNPFAEKLANVFAAGGVGVIVVNNVSGTFSASLGTGYTSPLTAVTMTLEEGTKLKLQIGRASAISATRPDPFSVQALANTIAIMQKLTVIEGKIGSGTAGTPPTLPVIVAPSPDNMKLGATIRLTATADGSPAPSWKWKKNGTLITEWTSDIVVLPLLTDADTGVYTAIASNHLGSAQASATVNVIP